jgi:hypothetical protein
VKLPDVVGLMMCERIGPDPATGRVSLLGLFQALRFRTFPSPPQQFIVYTALYDGEGEGTMEVVASRLETAVNFHSSRMWITFPARWQIVNLTFPFTHCVFPAPGRCALTLRFDGNELTHRYLDIFRKDR